MRKSFHCVYLGVLVMALAGCAAKSIYPAVQEAAKQRCLRQPLSEQADCQARLNKDDYDTYNKKRATE